MLTVAIVRPTMATLTRKQWRGQENIPRSGGMILAANHLSMTDPLTISHYLYVGGGRWPTFMAKDGVFRIPVLGRAIRALGQIPVYRGRNDAGVALVEAEKALREDEAAVIVYPEGTCTRDPDLWPMVAKTGVARLALRCGVPVVPLAHWGEQHILPYGTKRLRLLPRKKVQLVAGPPVDLSAYADQPLTSATLEAATAEVMRAITELQAGIRGEEPPAVPYDPAEARRQRFAGADTQQLGSEQPLGEEQTSEPEQGEKPESASAADTPSASGREPDTGDGRV
ncbi:lysophospholipid acyltransferase family protein [Lipingzhangella sp. LS1_29]|uniref:Lysophospholipid acyltransferase family protein n=1 Tax=Lipingzhangella rawalii TaxID=2055835 RepID=A0ABU2H585_9ACTN|nr:lysophospholipid acyltransferase family protein [Lipingzhangella rawalii]MDS1270453.1 lysophospholipid acyltransferase family protein [Lipingzhangella rawalii]